MDENLQFTDVNKDVFTQSMFKNLTCFANLCRFIDPDFVNVPPKL